MPFMNDQHIIRLEAQLERLVEGAFAQLFGKRIRAQDIAMQLARAMEDGAEANPYGDLQPLAPDYYAIHLNPHVHSRLLEQQPLLAQRLSEHMLELAGNAGYRLNSVPTIDLIADSASSGGKLIVEARHLHKKHNTTAVLQRVDMQPAQESAPAHNPQLLMEGDIAVPLTRDLINIGRSRENHVVIDDPTVSRHHLQLRLRFGRYMLFDTQSNSGTIVNDVPVREHLLQGGDVICIGRSRMIYMEDHPMGDTETNVYPPHEFNHPVE